MLGPLSFLLTISFLVKSQTLKAQSQPSRAPAIDPEHIYDRPTLPYAAKGVGVVAISPNAPQALRIDELGYHDVGDSFDQWGNKGVIIVVALYGS